MFRFDLYAGNSDLSFNCQKDKDAFVALLEDLGFTASQTSYGYVFSIVNDFYPYDLLNQADFTEFDDFYVEFAVYENNLEAPVMTLNHTYCDPFVNVVEISEVF